MPESNKICWIITGGDTGTENQCRGIAEVLGMTPVIKRLKLKSPWRQLSPWLSFGHDHALAADSDPIDPPYPDLLIASGRKSIGIARLLKKRSSGKIFLVQIQDPHINPKHFDLVVVPQHDPMRGDNVLLTIGSTHRVTTEKMAPEKQRFAAQLTALPQPRIAVLIGGNSKSHRMTEAVTRRLAAQLLELVKKYQASLMITTSRRTGTENTRILREELKGEHIYFWDGTGDNPYFALLGYADHIIVTEDSVSMTSEALATGKPVYITPLEGEAKRHNLFHQLLQNQGYTRPFTGLLETWSYTPPNDTLKIADAIRHKMQIRDQ